MRPSLFLSVATGIRIMYCKNDCLRWLPAGDEAQALWRSGSVTGGGVLVQDAHNRANRERPQPAGLLGYCRITSRCHSYTAIRILKCQHIVNSVTGHSNSLSWSFNAWTNWRFCPGVTRPNTVYFAIAFAISSSVWSVVASTYSSALQYRLLSRPLIQSADYHRK